MAAIFLASSSPPLLPVFRRSPAPSHSRRRSLFLVAASLESPRNEEIVIVGGGIAGLATALSLHRLGVRSVVLEQAESLRTGGTSLTLFKNGWRILNSLGVGDELRSQFLELQGLVIRSDDGRELRSFDLKKEDPGQEVRAVERGVLLETLASRLPENTVQYSSRLKSITREGKSDETLLELEGGQHILAQIVIGCDGVRSPVAKWLGFAEPKYAGYCAFRGLGVYPDGQPFKQNINQVYGKGIRVGFLPISATKVYWFICYNSPSPGLKTSDSYLLKEEAIDLVRNWKGAILDIVQRTPDDVIVKTPLGDRWLWPGLTPPASANRVVVVGDAWHPMTPNLGQGACCALEDAVVLGAKLAAAINGGQDGVSEALMSYSEERWTRIFPLTVRSNVVGSFLQWDNPFICTLRNNIIVPKLVQLGPTLEHTNFEFEMPEPVV